MFLVISDLIDTVLLKESSFGPSRLTEEWFAERNKIPVTLYTVTSPGQM